MKKKKIRSIHVQTPWRKTKDWKYPYTGLDDPKYIKDRDKLFEENGNHWWITLWNRIW